MERLTKMFCLMLGVVGGLAFAISCGGALADMGSNLGNANFVDGGVCFNISDAGCPVIEIPPSEPPIPGRVVRVEQKDAGIKPTIPNPYKQKVSVSCPTGAILLSGGCAVEAALPLYKEEAYAQTMTKVEVTGTVPTGYTCGFRNLDDTQQPEFVVAYAVCLLPATQ